MHIADIIARRRPTLSVEFFPPRTPPGWDRLFGIIRQFELLDPDFVSVTYGAGGAARSRTHELVRRIRTETSIEPVPHLTCICHTAEEIDDILNGYALLGIGGIMALAGDAPRDEIEDCRPDFGHAIDLVLHIERFNASGRHPEPAGFGVGVAGFPEGHPATPNRRVEMDYLKRKVDAGADYICTQLFFDNHEFLDFRDRCAAAGIGVPVIAGIMPIVSIANYERIPSLALGSRYPGELIRIMEAAGSDESARRAGIDWAGRQCEELVREDVDGIHFYSLNRFPPVREIWERLGRLTDRGDKHEPSTRRYSN